MNFKEWFIQEGYATGAKLGLYPPIDDAIGQYPPLYATPRASDFITYFDIQYGKNGLDSSGGLVHYHDQDPRIRKHNKVNRKSSL